MPKPRAPRRCSKQRWKPASTRPVQVGPPVAQLDRHRGTDLGVKDRIERRQIDAPKVPSAVALQPLQYHARRQAPRDAGLHRGANAQMRRQAPDHAGQRSVPIVPAAVGTATDRQALRLEQPRHLRPQRVELSARVAWPRVIEALVQKPLPLRLGFVMVAQSTAAANQSSRPPERPIEPVARIAKR